MRSLQIRTGSALTLTAALLASTAGAQQVALWNNCRTAPNDYGIVTGSYTLSGVHVPVGGGWSEIPSDASGANAIAGFAGGLTEPAGGFRFADDFTVPAGVRWRIDKIAFFAYHTAPNGNVILPFDKMNLRVALGAPSQSESVTLFGDTTTPRAVTGTPTNAYRIFNTVVAPLPGIPDYTRNVIRVEVVTTGLALSGGTYWLDWQFADSNPTAEVFVPPVTHPGSRGVSGANAMQFRPVALVGGGQWFDLVDPGKPIAITDVQQDLPFIIYGKSVCQSDLDGDGNVDLNDFFAFLNGFDQTTTAGDVNCDGVVDLNDFFLFLNQFDLGC